MGEPSLGRETTALFPRADGNAVTHRLPPACHPRRHRAQRRASSQIDPRRVAGVLREEEGDIEEAERLYRFALSFRPDHPDALTNMAKILAEREEYEEAVEAIVEYEMLGELR